MLFFGGCLIVVLAIAIHSWCWSKPVVVRKRRDQELRRYREFEEIAIELIASSTFSAEDRAARVRQFYIDNPPPREK
jgi:hypothetical protein